jgi:glyoxylase-like metal-dependent hydrolase (beta-lactamase superfamily II)
MHPDYAHVELAAEDPDAALERRIEVALQSGVPEKPMRELAEQRRGQGIGIERLVRPHRELLPGVEVETDLGTWTVHETPGHAPSHVCLFQPERRLLISGDHLLGRVSLYYDVGWSPDPVGEFLGSLDVVEGLDARLCIPGHGRTFADVQAHIEANRALVSRRLERIEEVLGAGPRTAFDTLADLYGEAVTPLNASWWLTETRAYLLHLEAAGRVVRLPGADGGPERWTAA